MKKLLSLAILGLVLLSSCVKGFDGPEPEPTPEPTPSSGLTDEEIKNMQKIFWVFQFRLIRIGNQLQTEQLL